MKNLISVVIFALLSLSCFGQKVGILVAPQAEFSFKSKQFNTFVPILLITPIKKDKNLFAPRYNFSNNSFGLLYERELKAIGCYLIGMKAVENKGGYIGIGITRKVDEKSSLFLEFGTGTKKLSPSLTIGVLMPFLL